MPARRTTLQLRPGLFQEFTTAGKDMLQHVLGQVKGNSRVFRVSLLGDAHNDRVLRILEAQFKIEAYQKRRYGFGGRWKTVAHAVIRSKERDNPRSEAGGDTHQLTATIKTAMSPRRDVVVTASADAPATIPIEASRRDSLDKRLIVALTRAVAREEIRL